MHRQKVDLVLSNPIDDAVAADYDLSDVLDSQFRNGPPRAWIARQSVCGAEDSVGEHRRQLRRVPSNEQTDRLEIIGRLRRPPLLEPFRHTLADLFLTDQFTAVRLVKTSLDFVK